ncbi:hypothetical protein, partial [Rhizobium leucaenae]|uniref:hypothetical protein n=1 Tax=Rhizobium leucaenae TaxID=29450 RepID=UPI001AEF1DFA
TAGLRAIELNSHDFQRFTGGNGYGGPYVHCVLPSKLMIWLARHWHGRAGWLKRKIRRFVANTN